MGRRISLYYDMHLTSSKNDLKIPVHVCILTSTKNASIIITGFLAMIYKNEEPRTRLGDVGK